MPVRGGDFWHRIGYINRQKGAGPAMTDVFLKEQLELLRKLNDRVSKIQDDVNHNVELIAHNAREAERWRREERIYRERNAANDLGTRHQYGRRVSDRSTEAADNRRHDAQHVAKRSRIHGKHRPT